MMPFTFLRGFLSRPALNRSHEKSFLSLNSSFQVHWFQLQSTVNLSLSSQVKPPQANQCITRLVSLSLSMSPSATSPLPAVDPQNGPSKLSTLHPLAPLSAPEITNASELLRSQWPTGTDIQFKTIVAEEPSKADLLPYLEAEHKGEPLPALQRRAFMTYYLRKTVCVSQ